MPVRRWALAGPWKLGEAVLSAGAILFTSAALAGCGAADDDSGGSGGVAGAAGTAATGAGGVAGKSAGGASGIGGASGGGGAAGGSAGGVATGLCVIELRCEREIIDDEKRPCDLDITDAAGAVVYAAHAGVEIRGRSSRAFPKKNYSVELRTEAG